MRHDPAHVATDKEIEKIEKQIAKEYRQAHKKVSEKLKDYLSRFEKKDAKWQEWVKDGSKTEKEYIEWRKGQILVGERWKELRDTLAQDYANASKIALSICKEYAPDVYALNHNYATFEVEKGSLLDTSYTLYSRESVERMYRDSPKLYHNYGKAVEKEIKAGKQKAWDRKRIQSVLMQGLLQGESIPKLTKRLEVVTKGDHNAAIRNARTMMTGVQNAGRIDAYDRANKMGIPVKKQWLATVDGRTRHWHRELDGVVVDNDEPFENEFGKIMFPGDPEADGANVYNCRCTLLAAIKGHEIDTSNPDVRPMPKLEDMSYDEWKNGHKRDAVKPLSETTAVDGHNIIDSWTRREGEFEYAIEDAINAQGFDGIPEVVRQEEFNKAVKDSSFVAQRTYSASSENVLNEYRNQLYGGKWYVDCSTGGAQYGQGMYCASDYTGRLTDGIRSEMSHYQSINKNKGNPISYVETLTMKPDAKVLKLLHGEDAGEYIGGLFYESYLETKIKATTNKGTSTALQSLLDISRKKGENLQKYYNNSITSEEMWKHNDELNALQKKVLENDEVKAISTKALNMSAKYDPGVLATLMGYDAIMADGHGKSGSYTVILNRTKVIILGK